MMLRSLRLFLLLMFVTGFINYADAQQKKRPAAHWVDPDTSTPLGTEYKTFHSQASGGEVSYLIWLPPGYETDSNRRWPVVYWLHGLGGDQRTGVKCFLPQLIDAVAAGTAPPVIAVFANGMVDSFYHNSPDGKWPIENMVINDLVPHIDATYRTISQRHARAIEGYSMGGYGTAYLGFKYPQIFGVVSIMAGALFEEKSMNRHTDILDKMYGGEFKNWQDHHALRYVQKNAKYIREHSTVRLVCGEKDPLLPGNRLMDSTLNQLNIKHTFDIVPDIAHSSMKFYEACGPKICTWYTTVFEAE
jgi:enterochelin esterase-like enzyme